MPSRPNGFLSMTNPTFLSCEPLMRSSRVVGLIVHFARPGGQGLRSRRHGPKGDRGGQQRAVETRTAWVHRGARQPPGHGAPTLPLVDLRWYASDVFRTTMSIMGTR